MRRTEMHHRQSRLETRVGLAQIAFRRNQIVEREPYAVIYLETFRDVCFLGEVGRAFQGGPRRNGGHEARIRERPGDSNPRREGVVHCIEAELHGILWREKERKYSARSASEFLTLASFTTVPWSLTVTMKQ